MRPQLGDHALPEVCLPAILAPTGPPGELVRPVHHVLVEHGRYGRREPKRAIAVLRRREVPVEAARGRPRQQLRQRPFEARAVVPLALLRRAQTELFEHPLDELARKRKPRIGPNAEAIGQGEREPALHSAALNDHHLLLEGSERLASNLCCERIRKGFGSVAADELHALSGERTFARGSSCRC